MSEDDDRTERRLPEPEPLLIRPEDLEDNGRRWAGSLSLGPLTRPGGANLRAGPVSFGIWAMLEGETIIVRGWCGADVGSVCDRCLDPLRVAVDRDLELPFRPATVAPEDEEAELDDSDLATDYYSSAGVDLRAVLAEQILLGLPMKLVCRDDCQGLCPQCGVDLNDESCDCEPPVDPRLAQLAELRDKL